MFSVSFENENITSKPFTYIGKNEGATALFFTVCLGPKNLFFLFFLSHAHTMTNLKSVAHSICQTWYRILKIVVLNTYVPCSGRGLFTPNTLNGDLC